MEIVEKANEWLGTKFHYTGRIKKNQFNSGGVDCIGLVIEIGRELNFKFNGKNIKYYDYLDYSRFPNKKEMENFLNTFFIKIHEDEKKVGDLIYFNFRNGLEHVAIYVNNDRIIHCSSGSKKVVEEELTDYWREKVVGYYRYNIG